MANTKKKPWYHYLKWLVLWPILIPELPWFAMRRLNNRYDDVTEKQALLLLVLDVVICIGFLVAYVLIVALVAVWISELQ